MMPAAMKESKSGPVPKHPLHISEPFKVFSPSSKSIWFSQSCRPRPFTSRNVSTDRVGIFAFSHLNQSDCAAHMSVCIVFVTATTHLFVPKESIKRRGARMGVIFSEFQRNLSAKKKKNVKGCFFFLGATCTWVRGSCSSPNTMHQETSIMPVSRKPLQPRLKSQSTTSENCVAGSESTNSPPHLNVKTA